MEERFEKYLELLEKSEERIDRTNEMISKLSKACAENMAMYDKHLTSLENSRDVAQANAASSIEVSRQLSELMQLMRKDYMAQLDSLRSELHFLRDDYRKQLEEVMADYRNMSQAYTRLAENARSSGSKAEVKINSGNR